MLLANQRTWMMREDNDIVAGLREMARRAGMRVRRLRGLPQEAGRRHRRSPRPARLTPSKYCMTGTPTLLLNGTASWKARNSL
jgi:hypothetical protein